MRFERLEFIRYGALSDRELVFRPDASIHIVYGANEAGKSSALSAMGDLLFGFSKRKEFDFRHDASQLRVGASMRASDGSTLSFRRRRGNKETLLSADAAESPLREDALAPFLGGLTREVFQRAFGLNSERLRAGAVEMLRSEGELGAMLFSAASGLLGLSSLRARLETEADGLFAPRASKERRFYQVLARYEEARKAERDSELRGGDWARHQADIRQVEDRLGEIQTLRLETRQRIKHLQRLRQLHPMLAEIDAAETRLEAHSHLADLPQGLANILADRLDQVEEARRGLKAAEAEHEKAAEVFGHISFSEELVAEAGAITALFGQSGDFSSKCRDLPRVQGEAEDYTHRIAQLALRVGVPDAQEVERRQPSDADLAELDQLVAEGRELGSLCNTLTQQVAAERASLVELGRERGAAALIDPKPWRTRFLAIAPDLRRLEQRVELERRRAELERVIAEGRGRLFPPLDGITSLSMLALPSQEWLNQYRRRFEEVERKLERARAERRDCADEMHRLTREIADFESRGEVPSPERLRATRAARDAGFLELGNILSGVAPAPDRDVLRQGLLEYERLVMHADRLADLAIRDADRVSRYALAGTHYRECERVFAARTEAIAAHEREYAEILTAYNEGFAAANVRPGLPDDMEAWLKSVEALRDRQAEAASLQDEICELDAIEVRVRPVLAEVAGAVAPEAGSSLPPTALAQVIEASLVRLADTWEEGRTLEGRRQDTQRRLETLEQDRAEAQARQQSWQARYSGALPVVGLSSTASLEQANAALVAWKELPALLHERQNRISRVVGMRRDIAAFESSLGRLVERLAPELGALSAADAVGELRGKAEEARAARARSAEAAAALEHATQTRDATRQALAEALKALAEQSDVPEPELGQLIADLRRRDGIVADLAQCRERFSIHAEGSDETSTREELAGFDRDAAQLEIDALEAEDGSLVAEFGELTARHTDLRRQGREWETSVRGEIAAFQRQAAEAEMIEVAKEWVVLKLASMMLGDAMEKQRRSQADPLMRRAGELFSILTDGSFATLAQVIDDDDQPHLSGERPSGENVGIDGMSDGARDQLYLALRLAFVEDYARRNEAVPFIADDIFQTFDDVRTAAGLGALAQLSPIVQPILFTHERGVVDTATAVLGGDADILEL